MMVNAEPTRYVKPDWFTRNVLNPVVKTLTGLGVDVWGSRVLEVRGRKTGEWRSVPVNLLEVDGVEYLVAPRGQTQWVRNLRAAGEGRLKLGRTISHFSADEVADEMKPAILRPYLRRWKWEVGQFFQGVGPEASDEELLSISPDHPVFRIESRPGGT